MARQVVWTDPAWSDLEAAANYIARDSEHYAAAFVQEVKDAAGSLCEMAERGQIVPEFRDGSIRELLVRPYRLIYRCRPREVTILAVVHGARRAWRE
jgi:plasmid stabilization system protein ParE